MSSLKRNQSIELVVLWRPSGKLFVTSQLVTTLPRVGRHVTAIYEGVQFPDFTYESSAGYLAKRIRNGVAGSTYDPELQ